MFSLKEIFFQPLRCQPNLNTLHMHRNSTTRVKQIYFLGLDGTGIIVEYDQTMSECKVLPISLPEVQRNSSLSNWRWWKIKLSFSADCRILCMEILPVSKYNAAPAIIYGYAKTTGIPVEPALDIDRRFCYFSRTTMIAPVSSSIVYPSVTLISVK